jgi:hypothetical protein
MKRIKTTAYMVVSGDNRTIFVNPGATPRKAIRAFMREWGTSSGLGSTWRYWYRAGYRPRPVTITAEV